MSFPPGFLFQPSVSLALRSCPSFGSGVLLGPRTEELGRSSSGSAFAPYSGSGTSTGFSSHLPNLQNLQNLPYSSEPRAAATLSSFVSPVYDPSSLDYHPFGSLGPYAYGDASYRKNATRDATATLKAWLNEHRKNPYPTKGEKIMLAIITKMTLTQVSTWFANARRRLKKENKMTWTPRTRSEDEEDEDNIDLERTDEDEEPLKAHEETETRTQTGTQTRTQSACLPASVGTPCVLLYREDSGSGSDTDRSFTDPDFKDSGDRRLALVPGPTSSGTPPQNAAPSSPPSKEPVDSCGSVRGPNPAPKPKLWSLAEIATSSDKSKGFSDSSRTPLPLPRHLYYASPFLSGYSGFGPLGPLHGGSHLNGLQHTMLQRDCKVRSQSQLDLLELQGLKRGTTNL